jgi:hypothetical protein
MSTRDEVRRELKELAKLAETIRARKEHPVDAPPGAAEWSALVTTGDQAHGEALAALAAPEPRPSRATVPPVSPSQPSVSSFDAGGFQNSPIYRRRPGLALAAGAALVCAVAGTAAVGRSVLTKPPVAAAQGAARQQEAVAKPPPNYGPAPTFEPVAAPTPAKHALPESEPVKASAVAPSPPSAAPSRPPQKPAAGKTGDSVTTTSSPKVSAGPRSARPASSAEQSLDDLIRKTLAAPAR